MIKMVSNATVNGLQHRIYKNKDGKMVAGYNVHFGYPLMGEKDAGYGCGVCYASADYVKKAGLDIGSAVTVCEVGFGKDAHFEIAE